MRPCFGIYRSPVAVGDKDARSILLSQDALRRGNVLLERRLRLLNDADVVAIFDKNVVNTLPARTIYLAGVVPTTLRKVWVKCGWS